MKKLFISISALLAIFILVPAVAMADSSKTTVSGVVTQNGNPVSGATVTIDCNGIKEKTTTTTVTGAYSAIFFFSKNCPAGSTAVVTATKGGQSGTNTGPVDNATKKINVAIVNVSIVPELGLITGVSAAILAGGAFLVIRRHQLGAN